MTFKSPDEAKKAILALMQQFGVPQHVAWFHLDQLLTQGGETAVETQGVAATKQAAEDAVDAFAYLAGTKAKP